MQSTSPTCHCMSPNLCELWLWLPWRQFHIMGWRMKQILPTLPWLSEVPRASFTQRGPPLLHGASHVSLLRSQSLCSHSYRWRICSSPLLEVIECLISVIIARLEGLWWSWIKVVLRGFPSGHNPPPLEHSDNHSGSPILSSPIASFGLQWHSASLEPKIGTARLWCLRGTSGPDRKITWEQIHSWNEHLLLQHANCTVDDTFDLHRHVHIWAVTSQVPICTPSTNPMLRSRSIAPNSMAWVWYRQVSRHTSTATWTVEKPHGWGSSQSPNQS